MKFVYLFSMMLLLPTLSWAQGNFGLGAIIGDPTGISAEARLNEIESIDFAVAWTTGSTTGTHIHSDYLIKRPRIGQAGTEAIDLYYGIGGRMIFLTRGKDKDKIAVGPRAPLGVSLTLADPSVTFFAQAAMILDLTPDTDVDLDIGIGLRYYF